MKEYKIGVIGNHFVGKTTFILNFITNKVRENRIEDPNEDSNFGKFLEIENETIFIRLFENPEKQQEMDGIIYLFSLNDKQSFKDLIMNYEKKCDIFVGNEYQDLSCDFENEIYKFIKEMGCIYYKCNILKDNLNEIFIQIIQIIEKNKIKKVQTECNLF